MAHDGQAESEAALPAPRPTLLLAKPLEDVWQELGRNSHACVRDGQFLLRSRSPETQLHAPALGRELRRIRQEVPHDLLQPLRIAGDQALVGIDRRLEPDALAARAGRIASTAPRTMSSRFTWRMSRRSFPVITRETSSRSSISRV